MSWTTIVWSMHSAACLTLMAVYLAIGLRRRGWQNVYFAVTAFAAAAMGFGGIVMMQAKTTTQLETAIRWLHVPVWILAVSFVLFVRTGLRAGNPILGWVVIAVRTAALAVNFLHPPNLNYDRITGVGTMVLWGERISVTEGIRSHWSTLGETAAFLLVVFMIGATREVWRRGDRRRAVLVCGSMLFVATFSWLHTSLVHAGVLRSPYLISVVYIVVVVAMYSELTRQVVEGAEMADRLREAERHAALSDAAAGIGHWTWDVRGRKLWMSERARALYGRPPDEPIEIESVLRSIDTEDGGSLRHSILQSLATRGEFDREYGLTLAGGERRWIYSRGRIERDPSGSIQRILGVSLDVTRSRTAELEVEKQRNELAHLSRVAVLGALSGSLAHELNQPLTAILFNSQAALRMLERESPDLLELRAILTDIVDQDRVAGEVIRRLRLLLTKGEVHRQPLDVEEVIHEVLKLARGELVHQGVLTAMEIRHGLPAVQADRIQLQQVLLNLVTNACDAMSAVDRSQRVLTLRVAVDPTDYVRVSALDRGPGLAEDVLPRVFQPFFTTKPTGMGLGLAVCTSIIQAHGGRLWAENLDAGGAMFSFTLPAASEPGAPLKA